MALRVSAYKRDPITGEIEFLDYEHSAHLAGFESSRQGFWGADIMKVLGLRILPQLAERNIDVTGEQLDVLKQDIEIILQNTEQILKHVKYDEHFVTLHTSNIMYAINKAKEVNGGVAIT